MEWGYTEYKSVQILLAIMKANGIRKIIASPGTTNLMFVASVQSDPWFEVYSSVDERSAAYMACGLAAETSEPVVLSCTGATASRNYLPGLTEAYYRHLPILAITCMGNTIAGNNVPQIIDRSVIQNDVAKLSVTLPEIHTENDSWKCNLLVNKAILTLRQNGGGPVHIHLPVTYTPLFDTKKLPCVRVIKSYERNDQLPKLSSKRKIAVCVGEHKPFSEEEIKAIDSFCKMYDAVVFCDQTSNYQGGYRVNIPLIASQDEMDKTDYSIDIGIDIGNVSGNYYQLPIKEIWRVDLVGECIDRYRVLTKVFVMSEREFFEVYADQVKDIPIQKNLSIYRSLYQEIFNEIPELPFSNAWIAKEIAHRIPKNSMLYLGILNSLRSWNFFSIDRSIRVFSNVGGFGIDGGISALLGASLADRNKLYFGVVGDLGFFYDMNAIGNRHVGNNIRLLVVNNGKGTEFRAYDHPGNRFGENADAFIAAAHHFGNKSSVLVKHYAQDLGFCYMSASSKEEFNSYIKEFLDIENKNKPILFEVFTESVKESDAIYKIRHVKKNLSKKTILKKNVKDALGYKNIQRIKKIIGNR